MTWIPGLVPADPKDLPAFIERELARLQLELSGPELRGYSATLKTVVSVGGVLTLDLSEGNAFKCTLSENITSIAIANYPTPGVYAEFVLKLVQGSGSAFTVAWPAAFRFRSGADHVMTATLGAHDWLAGRTEDGVAWDVDFGQDYQ